MSSKYTIRNSSPTGRNKEQEVSFSIKRSLGARKGWKIMADDGYILDGSALKTVVGMIKDMECQVNKLYQTDATVGSVF